MSAVIGQEMEIWVKNKYNKLFFAFILQKEPITVKWAIQEQQQKKQQEGGEERMTTRVTMKEGKHNKEQQHKQYNTQQHQP